MTPRHFLGLDLGPAKDFTALAVLERGRETPRSYAVRHLQRWPPGSGYSVIVEDLARRVAVLEVGCVLALDTTAVGRAVVDLVRTAGISRWVYALAITAGHGVAAGPAGPLIPKKDLVSVMQVLLQDRRLKVASTLPEARTLVAELSAFRAKVTAAPSDDLAAWREGAHDDLVLAVAVAAWVGENWYEPYTGPVVYWPPVEFGSD